MVRAEAPLVRTPTANPPRPPPILVESTPRWAGAGAGGGASLAASRSYADSRSTAAPYSFCNAEPATAALTAAASAGAIRDRGARSRVHATGVGTPRSDITVTTASPVPREVSVSSSS